MFFSQLPEDFIPMIAPHAMKVKRNEGDHLTNSLGKGKKWPCSRAKV